MMKYREDDRDIAVESSTSGKYVAHLLMDNGFHLHLANLRKIILHDRKEITTEITKKDEGNF
ncbi:hypothetical protein ACNF40_01000 [Cuniculiplasma sp. SKW4]|uniref:hypothetical protein n=1 Tax=Cuniculiplasma sp. SKW4 TaxID=3400171 RepID=UPI003FD1EBC3